MTHQIIQPSLFINQSVYPESHPTTPKRNNNQPTIKIVGSVAIFLAFSKAGIESSVIIP
jgi:hypothetical protein